MGPIEIILLIVGSLVGLAALLFAIYALILVRPGNKIKPDPVLCRDYAHRGLHGNGVPENSLTAFELACQGGYGIELDVQLSSDGVVMVFHDYTLTRVTGVDKKLCELTASDLSTIHLAGTEDTVPTFEQVLSLINGRVPVLVELKGESFDTSLCSKVADILKTYSGPYCVESFNPLLIKEIKKYLPGVFRGQLYTNTCRDKNSHSALNIVISLMALNFLAKPDFIAYNKLDRDCLPVKLSAGLYRSPRFVWTTKGAGELETAHKHCELPIFEDRDK